MKYDGGMVATSRCPSCGGEQPCGCDARVAGAYLKLEPSETAVLHAASRILAAYIAAGAATAENEQQMADRAVKVATRMALVIDRYIQSDNEER
jgi:hypothetical protein